MKRCHIMKVIFFPGFCFLYSVLERWLHNKAQQGLILVDRKCWFWYFAKRTPSNRNYFLWLRRGRGKDCLSLAIQVNQLYGNKKMVMFNNYALSPCVTEVVDKKMDDYWYHYIKKRNYICMKIAAENFFIFLIMAIISVITRFHPVIVITVTIVSGLNLFLNFIQYACSPKKCN